MMAMMVTKLVRREDKKDLILILGPYKNVLNYCIVFDKDFLGLVIVAKKKGKGTYWKANWKKESKCWLLEKFKVIQRNVTNSDPHCLCEKHSQTLLPNLLCLGLLALNSKCVSTPSLIFKVCMYNVFECVSTEEV